ncbi:apoptosis regulator BAX-like [Salarias fasciatus]|uniref:apoptosis regulator BAX-like n=1 Tax=Salarias fasciatus TaxID=181472 RepID=UPI001176D322|nr:apoptosis regulator BAX-like [Salarias fasciatus]
MLQVDPVLTEDERTKLAKMLHAIGEELDNNKELQALINSSDLMPARDHFMWVVNEVFEHGITWTRIVVLFYFAGRMAVKANLPQSVRDLRRWIRRHGGWINCFSHLAISSKQRISSLSSHSVGIFIAGVALGSVTTWRLSTQL